MFTYKYTFQFESVWDYYYLDYLNYDNIEYRQLSQNITLMSTQIIKKMEHDSKKISEIRP